MGNEPPSSALEIHEDLVFQRREWLAERIGWGFVLGIVLAALLGLLGPGPLSSNTLGKDGARVRVEYQRMTRIGHPSKLRLLLSPGASGEPVLEINKSYLEQVNIEAIVPEPERQEIGSGDFVQWRFAAAEGARPFPVVVHHRHIRPGKHEAELRFEGETVRLWQWVYP